MKVIFVIFFIYFINSASATNYYFSSVSGNDSRTTSEAQDPATPWKTLDKLNSFFITLKPGDSILLKRDEVFYGSIIISKSGSVILPITIGAYGSGAKPVITSFITLSNWVSKGKGIWECADSTLGPTLNMVLLNGAVQEMGRYPNSNAPNKGYLNFESHFGTTSITDNELNTSINWAGAELVTRPRHWILNRSLITAHSGRTISYVTNSRYEPYENYGYFIQNSLKTLDKPGEWYFDPSTKKLSIYFGTKNPSSYEVSAATTQNNLISSRSRSNIIFDNLLLKGSNISGFYVESGSNIKIQNCDILFSGVNGVIVRNHKHMVIENCNVAHSNTNGIDLEYGIINAVVKNNKITNTAIFAGLMQNGEGVGLGISSSGDGVTLESNEIRKTGFIGLAFYGNNITVKNNFIDSFCFVKDDGGGIYSHGEPTRAINRKLIGNIIMNGIGAGPGTDQFDKRSVTGIYMDANITDVEIRDNTITTCHQGIFIQSSSGMIIKNNTVFDNVRQMTIIRDKDNEPVRNSIITQNIFFSKDPDQWSLYIMSSDDDIKLFGRFDSNYYARPLDDKLSIYNYYIPPNGIGVTKNLDLNGWKEFSGQDKHSKKSFKQIIPYKIDRLKGSNKFINGGDFTDNVKGVNGSSCITPWSNKGMLDGGYLEIVPSNRASSVFMKVDAVTAGKKYVLSYSLRGAVEGKMSIGANLKLTGFPYTAITPSQYRNIDIFRTENEMIFLPATSESSVNLTFKVDDQSKYFLDNIKFHEADVHITNPDDSIRFEYNATNSNRSVALNGNYVDATGKLYLKKIVLQPYTSAVLIRTRDNIKSVAPIVTITAPVDDTIFSALSSVYIKARASDADGSIAKVEFFNNTVLIKTIEEPDYGFTLDSLAPGNYMISAKATDNNGLFANSSPVSFTVAAENIAPTVTITKPKDSIVFPPFSRVLIQAKAEDIDGSVLKVEFFNDSTLLNTETKPIYDCVLDSLLPGKYTITARATDNNGYVTISSPVIILISSPDVGPVVNIVTPADNTIFKPLSTVYIKAEAADAEGAVSKVEFFNGSTLLKTDFTPPYDCNIDKIAKGNYTITAKATDDKGLFTISSPIAFTVSDVKIPPTIVITLPADNATYLKGGNVYINAIAADADGTISKVEYFDGPILLYTTTDTPYTFKWQGAGLGVHTLTAKATDNDSLVTISSAININIVPNKPPVTDLIKPLNDQIFTGGTTIRLQATASDSDGRVTRVEFFSGTTFLATKYAAPYIFNWTNVLPGAYTVTAKAFDNWGATTISSPINFSVVSNIPPGVSSTSPASSQSFTATAEPQQASGSSSSSVAARGMPDQLPGISDAEVTSAINQIEITHGNNNVSNTVNERLSGQSDLLGFSDLMLYPNPVVNIMQLYLSDSPLYRKATVTIQNMSGVIVKKYPITLSGTKLVLDVSSLSSGIYIISLSADKFTFTKKFMKLK